MAAHAACAACAARASARASARARARARAGASASAAASAAAGAATSSTTRAVVGMHALLLRASCGLRPGCVQRAGSMRPVDGAAHDGAVLVLVVLGIALRPSLVVLHSLGMAGHGGGSGGGGCAVLSRDRHQMHLSQGRRGRACCCQLNLRFSPRRLLPGARPLALRCGAARCCALLHAAAGARWGINRSTDGGGGPGPRAALATKLNHPIAQPLPINPPPRKALLECRHHSPPGVGERS
ncbi:hypothetical protein BS50DRAFT_664070 [Corynespora cassiicola Philippines]|uniref:Uncharacterized protein n=1 Tax=Corynespora cassiicola Philippines TaxID=1448308 RepID=A0A2T2NVT5_CORCC|nr:hypothetical protein BS50DRAFT_664070 [Corynespora cassiicola Philippines]